MSKELLTPRTSTRHYHLPKLFQLVLLSTVIVMLGGGVALLWNVQHETQIGHTAGDVSVVGLPTLSSATIDTIFTRLGSPMVGTGKVVEQASRQTNIDDAFAMGVWWTETNDGAAGVGLAYRNPGSMRGSVGYPSAYNGYTIYPSYSAAISYWFNLLRNGYVNGRGISTVYAIARPYVGTTSYALWAAKVINLMWQYRGEAPPPAASTSTPTPQPTVNPAIVAANQARQKKLTFLQHYLSDDNSNSIGSMLGETQETIPYPTRQQTSNDSPLSPTSERAIVLFGLLTALAIVLYALRLKIESSDPATSHVQTTDVPAWDGLIPSSTPAPSTEDLPPLAIPASSLPSQDRQTDALPGGMIMLPSRAPAATSFIGTGARTTGHAGGLLSRYSTTQSQETS